MGVQLFLFLKLVVSLSQMVCHLNVTIISMDLGFIEMNMTFFNIEKEKRNCFAIMPLSVH